MGVKGRVPNRKQTGAFKAGARLKAPANQGSPRAEPGKSVHPFPFVGPAVVHFCPSNDVTSGRYPLL